MTPADRVMPVVTASWNPGRRRWLVLLPGGIELPALDEFEVREIVAKHATGAAVQFIRPTK